MGSQVVMATSMSTAGHNGCSPYKCADMLAFRWNCWLWPCLLSAQPLKFREVRRGSTLCSHNVSLFSKGEKFHPRVRIQTLPGPHWSVDTVTLKSFISIWVYGVSGGVVCLFLIFLARPCGSWDLSCLTRGWNHTPCSGNASPDC